MSKPRGRAPPRGQSRASVAQSVGEVRTSEVEIEVKGKDGLHTEVIGTRLRAPALVRREREEVRALQGYRSVLHDIAQMVQQR